MYPLYRFYGWLGTYYANFDLWWGRGFTCLCLQMVKKIQYFPGDMALLAFGMIAMGAVLSGLLYFFVLRNRVRSQMPTMRGFDNPLSQSVDLAK